MKSQKAKIIIRVEDCFGFTTNLTFAKTEQTFLAVHRELQKIKEGKILSIFISKEQQNYEQKLQQVTQTMQVSSSYEVELLKEQLLLFDKDQQMMNFIETQKCLAENCLQQLTNLSFGLMKLCRELLNKKSPLTEFSFKEENYTKQQLDKIESKCMLTLARVKQERKRIEACCICLSNKSNTVILPCMHLVVCRGCSNSVIKCPICMQPIIQIRQVFQ